MSVLPQAKFWSKTKHVKWIRWGVCLSLVKCQPWQLISLKPRAKMDKYLSAETIINETYMSAMSEKYTRSEEIKIETGKQYNSSYQEFCCWWNNQQLLPCRNRGVSRLGSETGKQYNSSYQEARLRNNQQLSLCTNWGVSILGSER